MNAHYQAAVAGLKELDRAHPAGAHVSEGAALAAVAIQASLAAAKATDDLLKAQETANLIAYAHLRREQRRPSLATEELVAGRMSAFPSISEELDEDGDDL